MYHRWTWVWVNSRSWWWTGWPGVLQFMGSQRVGHDWVTDMIWSDAILLFTASDLASVTSHIHNWVLFLLWLHPFLLSGVISPLISSSILGTCQPGESIFHCPIFFCLFLLFMGFSRQEYWSSLPFPSPVDHILSELSTMAHPSWVAWLIASLN